MRNALRLLAFLLVLAGASHAATIEVSQRSLTGLGIAVSAVAVDPAGVATVVWYETGENGDTPGVYGRRFEAGAPLGPVFQVNTTPVTADLFSGQHYIIGIGVAVGAGGRVLVVWPDGDTMAPRLFARLYEPSGSPSAPTDHVIALDGGDQPSVAGDNTGFLVTWGRKYPDDLQGTYDDSAMALRLDASGQPVGSSIEVHTQGTLYVPIITAVTYTGTGYAIAWKAADGLRARRFDVAGTPLGGEIVIGTAYDQPSIASDGTGAFTIVTRNLAPAIVALRFDADGNPVGPPVTVSSTQTPNHNGFAVAMGSSGEAVAVWIVQDQVADRHRVVGRRLDATNAPLGDEFILTERELLSLILPAAAWIEPTGFFATWNYRGKSQAIQGFAWRSPAPALGRSLKLKDHVDATKRKITFKSRDAQISTLANLGFEPDEHGLSLHVFNTQGTGESACITLPAAGWTATGTPSKRVFKYRDAAFAYGPCKTAVVRDGQAKATCVATVQPIAYSLDEPSQGGVGVTATSGLASLCTEFGGRITRDEPLAFTAASAPRPAPCPTPPVPCP
jgi:hypothetical protein